MLPSLEPVVASNTKYPYSQLRKPDEVGIFTEIVPDIFLGDTKVAQNAKFYKEKGIKGVINCTTDLPFHKFKMHQLRIAIEDTPNSIDEFGKCLELALKFMDVHKPVLVHCYAGMSRSPSIVAAYLIKYHCMSPKESTQLILNKRPFAFMNGSTFYYASVLNKLHDEENIIFKEDDVE